MRTITLSAPMELKAKMQLFPEVNWAEVSREELRERISTLLLVERISEIPFDDDREVNEELARDVVRSVERTIKSGAKPMTLEELDKLLGLK